MNGEKAHGKRAVQAMLLCGAAWLVFGIYGFWGMVYGWGPVALCAVFLIAAWVILAVGIVFAVIAALPTEAEVKARKAAQTPPVS